MIRDIVLSAGIAGLVAALVLSVLQSLWVTPLIVQAETYETGGAVGHSHHEHAHPEHDHASSDEHDHGAEWKPQDGWQRTGFTFAANLVMAFGYALMLNAVYLLWRKPRNVAMGAAYGFAGFLIFFLSPSLGLPPELPGTAAADVVERQGWWVMIAATTGAGLIILFSRVPVWARALGLVLIAVPHLFAAPQPEVAGALAPPELQQEFQIATTLCNAVFWLLLGAVTRLGPGFKS